MLNIQFYNFIINNFQPRQNLLNAASRVGEASTQVLHTIGEDTEENREIQVNHIIKPSPDYPQFEKLSDDNVIFQPNKSKTLKSTQFYKKLNHYYENFYNTVFHPESIKTEDNSSKSKLKTISEQINKNGEYDESHKASIDFSKDQISNSTFYDNSNVDDYEVFASCSNTNIETIHNQKDESICVATVDFGDDFSDSLNGSDDNLTDDKITCNIEFDHINDKPKGKYDDTDLYEEVDTNAWKNFDLTKRELDVIPEDGESDYYGTIISNNSDKVMTEEELLKIDLLNEINDGSIRFVRKRPSSKSSDYDDVENIPTVYPSSNSTSFDSPVRKSIFNVIKTKVKKFVQGSNVDCSTSNDSKIECFQIKNEVLNVGGDYEVSGSLDIRVLDKDLHCKNIVARPNQSLSRNNNSEQEQNNKFEKFIKRSESFYSKVIPKSTDIKNLTKVRIFYNPTFKTLSSDVNTSNQVTENDTTVIEYFRQILFEIRRMITLFEEQYPTNWIFLACFVVFVSLLIFNFHPIVIH